MRRSFPVVVPVILLVGSLTTACVSSATGSLTPRPASVALPAAAAADDAAARATVLTFLQAYAAVPTRGVKPLLDVIDPALRPWARMVRVQFAQFPGTQTGDLSLTSVGAMVPVDLGSQPGSVLDVAVHGEVTFRADPDAGKPLTYTRTFDGPMAVSRVAPSTWLVSDFVRDSEQLSTVFHAFDPPVVMRLGPNVAVALESMYAGTLTRWQFDVVVRVTGSAPATLEDAALVDQSGDSASANVAVPSTLARIEPGETAEGVIAFDPPSTSNGLALRLSFSGPKGAAAVSFPLPAASGASGGASGASASAEPGAA